MLTIEEIKNASFRRSGKNGYNAEDVDNFIDEVIQAFRHNESEKADIMKKIEILASKIEKYRADEDIIKNALLKSERIAESSLSEAKEKAAVILAEAEAKSNEILKDADTALKAKKDELDLIKSETADFRAKLLKMYKEQLEFISEIPNQKAAAREDKAVAEAENTEKTAVEAASNVVSESEQTASEAKEEIVRVPLTAPAQKEVHEEIDIMRTRSFSLKSSDSEKSEQAQAKKEKKRRKFAALKFGDNYDVEDDE